MAKYKAYPEYKDSGVEWLGEIPESWSVSRLKHVASIYGRIGFRGYTVDDIVGEGEGAIVLSPSNIVDEKFSLDKKTFLRWGKYYESPEIIVAKNDILLVKTGSTYGKSTIIKDLNEPMTINPQMALIKRIVVEPRFLAYLFNTSLIKYKIEIANTGSGMPTMTQENINNFPVLIPSTRHDTLIADFLDHETAKIDNLIEKQQQLIELLKEKRQAVISHAVTKGLNPDVPMKDSGVEWLGEVPEHWEVKRIKHFGKVIGGFAFKSTDFTDEGYPVIKISNVSHLSFDWGDSSFLPPSFSFTHKEYLAPNGALVFAMTRPVISGGIKVTLLDDDSAPLVNQRVGFMMVRSKNMARYILISTQSSAFLAHFVNNMTVTNQPNISSEGIESIYLPVPPMNEISRILLYVDRMNESYNQLIDRALLQVSLLQERRTALISAAVTGKIDVRDWVAPDTQDIEASQEATA